MSMSAAYLTAIAAHGASLVTHLGLVDDQGAELKAAGYARKAVSWVRQENGTMRPSADLTFNVPAGTRVAGWRGYAAAVGGTDFGGEALPLEVFNGAGQYTVIAKGTGIAHRAGV